MGLGICMKTMFGLSVTKKVFIVNFYLLNLHLNNSESDE